MAWLCISVKLKNLKANHNNNAQIFVIKSLCISVKLKNLKANHNVRHMLQQLVLLCISVKLKNLKANHNCTADGDAVIPVVYIRKVKKSESKSQLSSASMLVQVRCVYP